MEGNRMNTTPNDSAQDLQAGEDPTAGEGTRPEMTAEEGHRSLVEHATSKALEARQRFGPAIDYSTILRILQDSSCVRYPTRVAFTEEGIEPGMFASSMQLGSKPSDGFLIHVHPHFQTRNEELPLLIAYHIVAVNYGDIADADVAERFGAALLGLEVEDYYHRLCNLADELGGTAV